MKFIPFRKYKFKSNYPAHVVAEKLSLDTDVRKFYRKNNTAKRFEGKVHFDSFDINPILNYRNSFYPIISGKIIPESDSTSTLEIFMRMTVYTSIFMVVWFVFTITVFILALNQQLQNVKFEYEPILWSLLFVLVGYFLMIICFNFEANRAKKILIELL